MLVCFSNRCLSTCVTFAIFLCQNISEGPLPLIASHHPNNSSLFSFPVFHRLPRPLRYGPCEVSSELGSPWRRDNLLEAVALPWIRGHPAEVSLRYRSPLLLPFHRDSPSSIHISLKSFPRSGSLAAFWPATYVLTCFMASRTKCILKKNKKSQHVLS